MKKIIIPILLILCFVTLNVRAQEFNFQVTVNTKQVAGTDQRVYEALQEAVINFMNNRIWTNIKFEEHERIEGTMVIVVKNKEGNNISGELNIGLRRPVYKSGYNTPLLNYVDSDFNFSYIESQPLDFNDNSYMSNLTSMLAFYAYYSLGLYFDSFGLYGGEECTRRQNRCLLKHKAQQKQVGKPSTATKTVIGCSTALQIPPIVNCVNLYMSIIDLDSM